VAEFKKSPARPASAWTPGCELNLEGDQNQYLMKYVKILALALCLSAFAVGCACNKCCASKPACGMKCCTDAGTTCDKCATCSAKK